MQDASGETAHGGDGSVDGSGDGREGRGEGGAGGVGSGGSGSGPRSGQSGAQGGDLQSDGRGGFDLEMLDGRSPASAEDLQMRAEALAEQVREVRKRIGVNEKLSEMRIGDPRALGQYDEMVKIVESQVRELRLIFDAAEAKEKEREWVVNQSSGDIDENKLVDGVTGEKLIYRRRGEPDKPMGLFQQKPKRLLFVVDVSASMVRFNGQDGRLDRMAQTIAMILEALHGREQKFEYAIVGHSGNSPSIPFVDFGHPPRSGVERSRVVQNILGSAGISAAGDSTIVATELAITRVAEKDADDYLVFVLSDANLGAYGVTPETMAETLLRDEKVKAFAVFLSEPHAAEFLKSGLPVGRGHVCLNMAELPATFKAIFASAATD